MLQRHVRGGRPVGGDVAHVLAHGERQRGAVVPGPQARARRAHLQGHGVHAAGPGAARRRLRVQRRRAAQQGAEHGPARERRRQGARVRAGAAREDRARRDHAGQRHRADPLPHDARADVPVAGPARVVDRAAPRARRPRRRVPRGLLRPRRRLPRQHPGPRPAPPEEAHALLALVEQPEGALRPAQEQHHGWVRRHRGVFELVGDFDGAAQGGLGHPGAPA
mmetsp:Transcript_31902/g.101570  ORF Transcript_31902/g.101570 Transcript_31902/m.101570 type:complete len:222 (+) Transcript_31902:3733-4398(+)